jgi:CheY-like chemotaxis protein
MNRTIVTTRRTALAAGVIIGPYVLGPLYALDDVGKLLHFGEFGVVMLLFVIGLELRPVRLWALRSAIFGLGTAQLVATSLVLAAIGVALGLAPAQALFIGLSGFKRRVPSRRSDADFDQYFVKPVELTKLLTCLETRARAGAREAATSRPAPKERKPFRVLLVEDNADMAALVETLLRSEGLEVRSVQTGQEALKTAADFLPRLILSDQNLPDMKGGEMVRRLRSESATRRTHAVILTALSEAEIRTYNRAAEPGWVNEFIAKPLTRDALRGVLAKLSPARRVSPKRRRSSKKSS